MRDLEAGIRRFESRGCTEVSFFVAKVNDTRFLGTATFRLFDFFSLKKRFAVEIFARGLERDPNGSILTERFGF